MAAALPELFNKKFIIREDVVTYNPLTDLELEEQIEEELTFQDW